MHRPSDFYDDPSTLPGPQSRERFSVLDGHLRQKLYEAIEHFGTEAAFAKTYGVNATSVGLSMNGHYPVRGAVLLAVISWTFGVVEPVRRASRFDGRQMWTGNRT